MYKLILPFILIALLSSCAPRSNQALNFYNVSDDSLLLTELNGVGEQYRNETISFQAAYDDVYYQALRIARSMTMQQNPDLENWFSDNWYLASENSQIGDITITQGTNICERNRIGSCLPFQYVVKVSVREGQDNTRNVFIHTSDWQAQSKETQFMTYYINALKKALN